MVRFLMERGADPNGPGPSGWKCLMPAAHNGFEQCVKVLLEYGADATAVDSDGRSAVHLAAQQGQEQCFQILKGEQFLNILISSLILSLWYCISLRHRTLFVETKNYSYTASVHLS